MKVILISGKAQNGKDTVAKILEAQLCHKGYRVLITHYADLLKYICKTYFGWNGLKDESGRRILQYVGTDVIRKQNPSFWVDFEMMILKYFHANWDYVIIPDCRFPNEINTVRENGFESIHIKVTRKNFDSPLTKEQRYHPSEIALDNVKPDIYINNDGTIPDLKRTIIEILKNNIFFKNLW